MKITIDLHLLAQNAGEQMEDRSDLNWSIGAAIWETLTLEQSRRFEEIMLETYDRKVTT